MRFLERRSRGMFRTQLFCLEREGVWPDATEWHVAGQWVPIESRTLSEAEAHGRRLRRDNRWGSANRTPHVTITGPDGVEYPA